jgi:nucleotide-binding universal stress UspA family protein
MMNRPIIAGVDGSPQSLSAAETAAREAGVRGRPLRVVHGFIWPYMRVPLGPSELGPATGGLRHEAERIVSEAVDRARAAAPGVDVTGEVVTGSAAQALISRSAGAVMIVVGDRGLGAFTGLLAGSVAVHVAAHAACPVMVVRGRAQPSGPILLACDGSPAGEPAVGFAFQEAALRDVELEALHVWRGPAPAEAGDILFPVYDEALVQSEEERVLAEALAGWHEKYPDVPVHRRVVHGPVRRTVIEATEHSQLAIVGSRGSGGFAGLLLGSVSQAVLHHAACPLVVVPSGR